MSPPPTIPDLLARIPEPRRTELEGAIRTLLLASMPPATQRRPRAPASPTLTLPADVSQGDLDRVRRDLERRGIA